MRWVRDEDRGLRELRCIFANAAAGKFLDADPDTLDGKAADELIRLACGGMSGEAIFEMVRHFNRAVERRELLLQRG